MDWIVFQIEEPWLDFSILIYVSVNLSIYFPFALPLFCLSSAAFDLPFTLPIVITSFASLLLIVGFHSSF